MEDIKVDIPESNPPLQDSSADGSSPIGPNPPLVEQPSSPVKGEEIIAPDSPIQSESAMRTRLSELEAFLSERDKEISSLKESLEQAKGVASTFEAAAREREASLTRDHGQAIARVLEAYRQSIVAANPDIPDELLSGSNIEEFQASLAKARALVQKIRGTPIVGVISAPAGAPIRSGPDLSGLSPREKIIHGLKR